MYDFKIDYVFPFVNNTDPQWINEYNKYSDNSIGTAKCRFRDFGTLKSVFRGISENLPWINNVYLLVSSKSQIPEWLNTDTVKVITHDQFIPKKYLPTFNSSTIELFLHNIPGLEEHFIYGNDDTYIYKPLGPEAFFDKNGNPIIEYENFKQPEGSFHKIVKRSYDNAQELYDKEQGRVTELEKYLAAPNIPIDRHFLYPAHFQIGLLKSTAKRLVDFLYNSGRIDIYATKFRNIERNVNQYMYSDYQIVSNKFTCRLKKDTLGLYLTCHNNTLEDIEKAITTCQFPLLCFNDAGTKIDYIPFIKAFFDRAFPNKCKYEK